MVTGQPLNFQEPEELGIGGNGIQNLEHTSMISENGYKTLDR